MGPRWRHNPKGSGYVQTPLWLPVYLLLISFAIKRAGIDEKSQEAINAVACIILSMDADRIEAVNELRYAGYNLRDYNYVVIWEASHYQPVLAECIMIIYFVQSYIDTQMHAFTISI